MQKHPVLPPLRFMERGTTIFNSFRILWKNMYSIKWLPIATFEDIEKFEKTCIMPRSYLMFMYKMMTFLQAISEESRARTNAQHQFQYSPPGPTNEMNPTNTVAWILQQMAAWTSMYEKLQKMCYNSINRVRILVCTHGYEVVKCCPAWRLLVVGHGRAD